MCVLGYILHLLLTTYVYFVGISCGLPGTPSNGSVNTSAGTSFGDVARYSCEPGYKLNGQVETTCQANRSWNGSVPTCESKCPTVLMRVVQ